MTSSVAVPAANWQLQQHQVSDVLDADARHSQTGRKTVRTDHSIHPAETALIVCLILIRMRNTASLVPRAGYVRARPCAELSAIRMCAIDCGKGRNAQLGSRIGNQRYLLARCITTDWTLRDGVGHAVNGAPRRQLACF